MALGKTNTVVEERMNEVERLVRTRVAGNNDPQGEKISPHEKRALARRVASMARFMAA